MRLGDARTRLLYQGLLAVALADDAAVDARNAVVRGGADRGASGVAGGPAGAHGRRRQGSHPGTARHRVDHAGVVGRGGAGVDVWRLKRGVTARSSARRTPSPTGPRVGQAPRRRETTGTRDCRADSRASSTNSDAPSSRARGRPSPSRRRSAPRCGRSPSYGRR